MNVAIKFSDNDFHYTITNFLEILCLSDIFRVPIYHPGCCVYQARELTKDQVVELFNSMAYGIYLMFQNTFRYGTPENNKYLKEDYLQITTKNVYFNEEITQYINDLQDRYGAINDNGEFFVLMDNSVFSI